MDDVVPRVKANADQIASRDSDTCREPADLCSLVGIDSIKGVSGSAYRAHFDHCALPAATGEDVDFAATNGQIGGNDLVTVVDEEATGERLSKSA